MSISGIYVRDGKRGYNWDNKMGSPFILWGIGSTDGRLPEATAYIDGSYYGKFAIYGDLTFYPGEGERLLIDEMQYFPDLTGKKTSYTIKFVYGSYTFETKIYLPSAVTIESISDKKLGDKISVDLGGIAKNFTCRLNLLVGNQEKSLGSVTYEDAYNYSNQNGLIENAEALCDYKMKIVAEYEFARFFKSSKSATVTIRCDTYNGESYLGRNSVEFLLTVPENEKTKPSIGSVEIKPITELIGELAPLFIRGKTGLQAQISASSEYSNITEYALTVGSISVKGNPGKIDILADSGDVTVTVKVTDARGFSRTVTQNIYVYPYSRPKITPYTGYADIICERAKVTGELSGDGTYLAVKAGKRFTSIVNDERELNFCCLRYRFKRTTAEDYGDWVTLLGYGSEESEVSVLAGNVVSDTGASYDVELSAVDKVGGERIIRFPIMTSAISFKLYDGVDGAAFGKYPEEPHVVDIASHMTLRVRGRLEVLGASWKSLGLADGMEESSYAYGRQDDTGCYCQVSNGNHVQITFNCSYKYAGTSQAVNLTPIQEEYRPARTVCSLCVCNDRRIALVTVEPDGYIRIAWVQTIASSSNTTSATVLWVDGYLDYWV